MRKNSFSTLSDEHLLRNKKTITILMCVMAVVIFILIAIVVVQLFTGHVQLSNAILPVALVPVLVVNLVNLKGMKKEIRKRGLTS